MNKLQTTLQHIAAILSFKVGTDELHAILTKGDVNWDNIVKVASTHLVLTTVYNRLKQRSLLHVLPHELKTYLSEISAINRNRNLTILEEVKIISDLFIKHKINHVFVKGAALLAGNYYKDYSERMIGDIDVLVQEDQVLEAYNLLKQHKYYPLEVAKERKHIKHRHLNRLIPKIGLAAVELHYSLLRYNYKDYLNLKTILNTKQQVNGIYVPNPLTFLHHNVLSHQINDYGIFINSLNLKSSYDSILILKNNPKINFKTILGDCTFKNYFLFVYNYFRDIPNFSLSRFDRLKLYFHSFKLKNRLVYELSKRHIRFKIFCSKFYDHVRIIFKHRGHFYFLIYKLKNK